MKASHCGDLENKERQETVSDLIRPVISNILVPQQKRIQ